MELTGAQKAQVRQSIGAADGALESGLAIIVDGDTAAQAVPAGAYAYIRNNTHGLANGLYTARTTFPATGGTADSTAFQAVDSGALNSLSDSLTTLTNTKFDGATNYPITAGQTLNISLSANAVYILFSSTNVCRAVAFLGTGSSSLAFAEYLFTVTGFGISASGLTLSVTNNTAYRVSFSLLKLGSTN